MEDKKNHELLIRQQAEEIVDTKNVQLSQPLHAPTPNQIKNMIHELEVHQVELEL